MIRFDDDTELSLDGVLFRYSLDDLAVMSNMLLVWEYDGGPLASHHGMMFWDDQEFSAMEQQPQQTFIMQTALPQRYFGNKNKTPQYDGLIARYFQWKRERLPTLVRCLRAFHGTVFRSSVPCVYRGIDYVRQHDSPMKMLLWCYVQSRQHGIIETSSNVIAASQQQHKISKTVYAVWSLFKAMKAHGAALHENFRVVVVVSTGSGGETYKTLYKKFRSNHLESLSKYAWKRMNESLFYAFSHLALQWWIPHNYFKLIAKK